MKSKINLNEIIKKHYETLEDSNGKISKRDLKLFFTYPVIIAVLALILIHTPSESLTNFFTLSLSVFIGLFLNLLVLIISFAENKLNIKDRKNRAELLKQTFYNITYTIVSSLLALGILLMANIEFLSSNILLNLGFIKIEYLTSLKEIPVNDILQTVFYYLFYVLFAHIIITLMMIIKRIFKLFDVEIMNV